MNKLIPFADDAGSVSIGSLTIENGTDRVTIYGSLDLTRDKQGLAHAEALKALLDQAVQHGAERAQEGAQPFRLTARERWQSPRIRGADSRVLGSSATRSTFRSL